MTTNSYGCQKTELKLIAIYNFSRCFSDHQEYHGNEIFKSLYINTIGSNSSLHFRNFHKRLISMHRSLVHSWVQFRQKHLKDAREKGFFHFNEQESTLYDMKMGFGRATKTTAVVSPNFRRITVIPDAYPIQRQFPLVAQRKFSFETKYFK